MEISTEILQSAANSRLGRLDIQGSDGDSRCVLRSSFSGWVVHIFRYKFSKNYRTQELEKRSQILVAALGGKDKDFRLSEGQQEVLLNRRGFNRYIQTESEKLVRLNPNVEVSTTTEANTSPASKVAEVAPVPREDSSVENTPAQEPADPANTVVTQEQSSPPVAVEDPGKNQPPVESKKKETAVDRLSRPTASSGAKKRSTETAPGKGNKTSGTVSVVKSKKTSDTKNIASTSASQRSAVPSKYSGRSNSNQPVPGKTRPNVRTTKTMSTEPINTTATVPTGTRTQPRGRQQTTNKFIQGSVRSAPADNAAWITQRNKHVSTGGLDAGHFADIFEIRKEEQPLAYEHAISSTGHDGRLISPIATLEKRIGERLQQYVGASNTNTNSKHVLTYLTLKNKNAPSGTLFEEEHMEKSSQDATWQGDLEKGGMLGVPLEADGCVRRVPNAKLMHFVDKVIKELPVDPRRALTSSKDNKNHPILKIHDRGSDPEYRKQFSQAGEELTEADFKWVVANIQGFVEFCKGN